MKVTTKTKQLSRRTVIKSFTSLLWRSLFAVAQQTIYWRIEMNECLHQWTDQTGSAGINIIHIHSRCNDTRNYTALSARNPIYDYINKLKRIASKPSPFSNNRRGELFNISISKLFCAIQVKAM